MDSQFFLLVLAGWCLAGSVMTLLWFLYLVRDEPSVVDVGWTISVGLVALRMHVNDSVAPMRHHLLLGCVILWCLRLFFILMQRFKRGHKDLRYDEMSARWGKGLWWKYFLFYQAQALSVVLLSIPFALTFTTISETLSLWDYLGTVVFAVGFVGVAWADWTMSQFRGNPKNRGKLCKQGLWYYSRHPNYFFELTIWCGFAIFALNSPYGLLGFIAPLSLGYFILYATGVPPTEAHLLETRGDAYREYQRTTNKMIPWFPKD